MDTIKYTIVYLYDGVSFTKTVYSYDEMQSLCERLQSSGQSGDTIIVYADNKEVERVTLR
jgi:hypothetical protein